jgi:hypothetical protein
MRCYAKLPKERRQRPSERDNRPVCEGEEDDRAETHASAPAGLGSARGGLHMPPVAGARSKGGTKPVHGRPCATRPLPCDRPRDGPPGRSGSLLGAPAATRRRSRRGYGRWGDVLAGRLLPLGCSGPDMAKAHNKFSIENRYIAFLCLPSCLRAFVGRLTSSRLVPFQSSSSSSSSSATFIKNNSIYRKRGRERRG